MPPKNTCYTHVIFLQFVMLPWNRFEWDTGPPAGRGFGSDEAGFVCMDEYGEETVHGESCYTQIAPQDITPPEILGGVPATGRDRSWGVVRTPPRGRRRNNFAFQGVEAQLCQGAPTQSYPCRPSRRRNTDRVDGSAPRDAAVSEAV